MQGNVILLDADNKPIGVTKKIKAHVKGLKHKAYSVFILNNLSSK